jgi:hypothetical protein
MGIAFIFGETPKQKKRKITVSTCHPSIFGFVLRKIKSGD